MNTFLNKLSTLESIRDIILLSSLGTPLFSTQKDLTSEGNQQHHRNWQTILSSLDNSSSMELIFSHVTYYIVHIPIGYIIIGVTDPTTLTIVQEGCSTVSEQLAHPAHCKRVLLNLLSRADDSCKLNIIKELVPYADHEVAAVLTFLLQKEMNSSRQNSSELLHLICQVLGYCSSDEAIPALNSVLNYRKLEGNNNNDAIIEAARTSLEQLNPKYTKEGSKKPPLSLNRESTKGGATNSPAITPTQARPGDSISTSGKHLPQQQQVQALLTKGKKEEALQLVAALIENCANKQEFTTAYRLREWLIEINPMALTEIIQTAELIKMPNRLLYRRIISRHGSR